MSGPAPTSGVVLLGDSLSVGAFPSLHELVPGSTLVAKVGASIAWMEGRAAEIAATLPAVVLVMGGTNDLPGAAPEEVFARLEGLVLALRGRGVPRVVVGLLPPQRGPGDARVDALNELLLSWRPLEGVRVEPVGRALSVEDVSGDPMGIHPSPEGYARLGAAWADVLAGREVDVARGGFGVAGVAVLGLALWGVSRWLRA